MIDPASQLKKRILTPVQRQNHATALGESGEEQAKIFLEGHGCRVLAQNVRYGKNEVDIIAVDQQKILIFCEVKTRSQDRFGHPSTAVNRKKIQSMYKVARAYMRAKKWHGEFRFDMISVIGQQVEWFENITW